MPHSNPGRFRRQVRFLQQQYLQDGNLPFSDILSTELIEQALTAMQVIWIDRIYTQLVTLGVFLGQVLSVDHSCRAAVASLIAYRVARKGRACSAETGAYCQARKRLPEKFFSQIARQTGHRLNENVDSRWLWRNRHVYIFDGATVSMPDTLENQQAYPPSELAELYRARWHAELDLKSLKQTMQMDVLRCKTPELVRKELWTHILAYNLIRTILVQAAHKHDLPPRWLSFKGAIQTLEAFQPVIALQCEWDTAHRLRIYHELLDAIATHRVADRPNRYEPRARKRHPKNFDYLRKPRF